MSETVRDLLTPVEHSLKIASNAKNARLEVIPSAGHMAMMERPGIVADHLTELIHTSAAA